MVQLLHYRKAKAHFSEPVVHATVPLDRRLAPRREARPHRLRKIGAAEIREQRSTTLQLIRRGDPSRAIVRARETIKQIILPLMYTSDAADDLLCVDLGGRRIIKK